MDFFEGHDLTSMPSAADLNPDGFDAEQVVLAAKSFGATYLVFTAKTHNGFCWWPTETTEYSIGSTPWHEGRGDIVGDLIAACRRHEIAPVLYVSIGDKHLGCHATPEPLTRRTIVGDPAAYWPVFEQQLTELLTRYGPVAGVWFDGAYDPFGWDVTDPATGENVGRGFGDRTAALVRRLQPQAAIFGGTQPDIRWSGSEQGWAPYPLWNVIRKGEGLAHWVPDDFGGWCVPEANIHTRNAWIARPENEHTLAGVERLVQAYDESVGRGANLLVSVLSQRDGRVAEAEVRRLAEFGEALRARYGRPLARFAPAEGLRTGQALKLALPAPAAVTHVIIREDLSRGQAVAGYRVEARRTDGAWLEVAVGQTIGRRRIQHWPPVIADRLQLTLTETRGTASIHAFEVFGPDHGAGLSDAAVGAEGWVESELEAWLTEKAWAVHDRSLAMATLADGTPVYNPIGYRGLWPRDMYYIVSGVPERVDPAIIAQAVALCLNLQRPNGTVPKNVAWDGSPGYVCWHVAGGFDSIALPLAEDDPIWDGQREKPEADAGQFLVLLAHEYWRRTRDEPFLRRHLPGLARAMDAMPRDASGLIWIDPNSPHTPYGFTDNVVKTGNELFCSLLYWQASRMLAEMAAAAEQPEMAADFAVRAERIERNIDRLKDAETGAYFAATETGRQIDIWGNAYLVYIGFPDEARRARLSRFLADRLDRFMLRGQVRHLLQGEYWQRTFRWPTGKEYTRGMFQNGAYWGTATGWVAYAVAQVDRVAAAAIFRDMILDYQTHGVQEYIYEDGRPGPMEDYAASVINPLAALRRLTVEAARPQVDPSSGGCGAPPDAGDWLPILVAPDE